MTKSRTLTMATLRKKGACRDQIALFRELFGTRVEVTEALAAEHAGQFIAAWAADHLLSRQARATYDTAMAQARATYDTARAQARAAYDAAMAHARRAAYDAAREAWDAYDAATAPAWDAYSAASNAAWAAYNAAKAKAWARAYINDGGDK